MNRDDVIPPSPPVKEKKLRSRSKCSKTSPRQKKRRRSILSLRMKNLQEGNVSTAEKMNIVTVFSEESTENTIDMDVCGENIYAGLDNVSAEEKNETVSMLNNFDILGHEKRMEQYNKFDLLQPRKIDASQRFSQVHHLASLKELLSSQDLANSDTESPEADVPCAPGLSANSIVSNEVKDISQANLQFSEWPIPINCDIPLGNTVNQNLIELNSSLRSVNETYCSGKSIVSQQFVYAQQPQAENQSNAQNDPISIVKSILDDFTDGVDFNDAVDSKQEIIAQSPQFLLVRRSKRKMYNRTRVAPIKALLFNDDWEDKKDDCDAENIQCTQRYMNNDLDASFHLVENLARILTQPHSLTQSNTLELDFNVDSTTMEQPAIIDFGYDQDDFLETNAEIKNIFNKSNDIVHDTPKNKETSKENCPSIHLLNSEEDIFLNIDTPKVEARCRTIKSNLVSTPLSLSKGRFGDSVMHTTPSTSKQAILSEQRKPKRLQFGAESVKHPESSAINAFKSAASNFTGFSTARGQTVQISSAQMKRTAALFADIDVKYKEIDPILEEGPIPKKIKHNNSQLLDTNQVCDSSLMTPMRNVVDNQNRFGVFGKTSGTNINETATNKALNFFGEDFSDLGFNHQPQTSFKPSSIAGPSGMSGFATARGSNIQVSAKHLQKYVNTFKEIDRDVREEFGMRTDANDENFVCKTPLSKSNQQSKAFATSTPNPNSITGFKNYPPITPITKTSAKLEEVRSLLSQEFNDNFNDMLDNFSTQQSNQLETTNPDNNTSVNLNDILSVSDLQLLNDSATDKGINVLNIPENIKQERENALSKQQADCFKKRQPIQYRVSSLHIEKLMSTIKLHDLGQPKKYNRNELERFGVSPNIIELNAENTLKFKFDMWKFYPEKVCRTNVDGIDMPDEMCLIMDGNSRVGFKELTSAFQDCPSVDPKLLPDHWIRNCLKWILVKLASYERSYPQKFSGKILTPENVLSQLKYRYEREIDKVERPAIRKIVEKDDSAAKRMVLFVSRILHNNLACTLELCDGWYSIKTSVLDSVLTRAVTSGKIVVGTKLVIQGAEIVGLEEACGPLEIPSSAALKITANSTRRARWNAKLGFYRESWPFAISLNSVKFDGGVITRMKTFVIRVYPMVFMVKQKVDDGHKTVFRSNKVEQRQSRKDDTKRFDVYEKLYSEASEEIEKEYEKNRKRSKQNSKRKICDIEDGEELWNYMENSNDSFEMDLSTTQVKLLEDYQTKLNEEKQNKISAIVLAKLDAMGGPTKSTPLQKVRLIDATSPCASKTAILSIWNAGEAYATLRENTFLDIQNVTANGLRAKDVQLTANNYTMIRELRLSPAALHATFARRLIPLAEINPQRFQPHFNEFDTIGFVLKVDEVIPNFPFQSVFIVDAFKNILCIKFWSSIQQYAYDDIVEVNKCLVISQLEWRPQNRSNRNGITQAFVTELTTFSESPKLEERRLALSDFKQKIDQMDLNEFIESCFEKLGDGLQANKENTIANISTNSSLNQTIVNRTGTIASPKIQSPSMLIQRVERLRQCGTPPAFRSSYLNKSHTPNGSRKPFKTPSLAQPSTSHCDQP